MGGASSMPSVTSGGRSEPEDALGNGTRIAFWVLALAIGFIVMLSRRDFMNPDGLSYLDMGDAFARRDWYGAINAYWSPLYGWLLGLALKPFDVTPRWEFLTVHLVNLGIYALALMSFDFFLRALLARHRADVRKYEGRFATFPSWVWYGVGFTLFIWSSMYFITLILVVPDMLNSAILYTALGLLVGMRAEIAPPRRYAVLGLLLGLGYLARVSMFPVALAFFAVALRSAGEFRRNLPRVTLGFVVFLLVAGSFVAALSLKQGHLTVGDSAKLNHAWQVDGVPGYWQGGPPGCGSPRHPPRKILGHPPVFEFGTPIVATNPYWFDPVYWYDGIQPCFNLRKYLPELRANVGRALDVSFRTLGALPVAIIAVFYGCYSTNHRFLNLFKEGLAANTDLLIIAFTGITAHVFAHVEPRYIAAFVTVLWLCIFSAVRIPRAPRSRQTVGAIMVAFMVVMMGAIAKRASSDVRPGAVESEQWAVAEGLGQMGVRPEDRVATLGSSDQAYWARLARAKIVAVIPDEAQAQFWDGGPAVQTRAIEALLSTGAKAIIAQDVPSTTNLTWWERIGTTRFFVYAHAR